MSFDKTSSSVLRQINKELIAFEKKKQALYAKLRPNLFEVFRPVFNKHINKKLDNFSWSQYSPYFNDGDECIFGVHEVWHVNGKHTYGYGGDKQDDEVKAFADSATEALYMLPEEFLKELFGNHVSITVYRDGRIVSEECDHD